MPLCYFVSQKMTISPRSFRKAVYTALTLSIFGLVLVSLPIVGLNGTIDLTSAFLPQIIFGYVAIILFIEIVGVPLRSTLNQYWAGALFAFCVFLIGAVAGSSTSMILYDDMDLQSYIVKPLFGLGLYGFIPASIIGVIGSFILRRTIKKANRVGGRF